MSAEKAKPTLPHKVWVGIDTLDADRVTFSGYRAPKLTIGRTLWFDLGSPLALNVTLTAVEEKS